MKLIIVRHGATEWNKEHRYQGQPGKPLNTEGKKQAKQLSNRFKNTEFDIMYTSDLSRAQNTAKEVMKHHPNTKFVTTKELRERAFGKWEGKRKEEVNWDNLPGKLSDKKPPGGESWREMEARAHKFMNNLLEKHHNETVFIVTHGGYMRALLSKILNKTVKELFEFKIETTAVFIVEKTENYHKVHVFNSVDHL